MLLQSSVGDVRQFLSEMAARHGVTVTRIRRANDCRGWKRKGRYYGTFSATIDRLGACV